MLISKPGSREVSSILGLKHSLEPAFLQSVKMKIGIMGPVAVLCPSQCQVHLYLTPIMLEGRPTLSTRHWLYQWMAFQILLKSTSLPHVECLLTRI